MENKSLLFPPVNIDGKILVLKYFICNIHECFIYQTIHAKLGWRKKIFL